MGVITDKPGVVCLGGNLESKICLEALVKAECRVTGAIVLPEEARKDASDFEDLRPLCRANNIPCLPTMNVNSQEVLEWLTSVGGQHLFVLGWSQIVSEGIRTAFKGYAIGSHPSPLPSRRGRAPIPWTILEGCSNSAVTLFELEEKVDSGRILSQRPFSIPERAYAKDVYQAAALELAEAFVRLYRDICCGTVRGVQGSSVQPSMRAKRVPADGFVDFHKSADEIDCLIRAVSEPFPGAYFYYGDKRITCWRCDPYDGIEYRGVVGQVLARKGNRVAVATGTLPIWLHSFTCDGVEVLPAEFRLGDMLNFRVNDQLFELEKRLRELERLIKLRSD